MTRRTYQYNLLGRQSGLHLRFEFGVAFFVRGCIGIFWGNGSVGGILPGEAIHLVFSTFVGAGEGDREVDAEGEGRGIR